MQAYGGSQFHLQLYIDIYSNDDIIIKKKMILRVCDPLRADTNGSINIGRYGNKELRRTGTVKHNSTNKSFMC
jgi:hypothetical protein